jgi:hypothetical protein
LNAPVDGANYLAQSNIIMALFTYLCRQIDDRLFGVCQLYFFIFPYQTGTATSSPAETTTSQSNMNIVNVMLWMKRNAYEESTIEKVAKLLRHLQKKANTIEPKK